MDRREKNRRLEKVAIELARVALCFPDWCRIFFSHNAKRGWT